MVVTLQAEVVDRIRAAPGTGEFGVLTLLLARTFQAGPAFRIPATCFFPAPDVESACVRLERRLPPLAEGAAAAIYVQLVKTAFSQRRKQLRKVLRSRWPEPALAQAWANLALAGDVRPEVLSPAQFADLARLLGPATGAG